MSSVFSKSIKLLYFIILLVITGFVLHHKIDLKLLYHNQQPIFITDFDSLINALCIPGGFADYLGSFFSVLYFYPFIGLLTTTIIVSAIPVIVYFRQIKKSNRTMAIVLSALLWLVALIVFTDYSFKQSTLWVLIVSFLFLKLLIFTIGKIGHPILQPLVSICILAISFMFLGGPGLILTFVLLLINILPLKEIKLKTRIITLLSGAVFTSLWPYLSVKMFFQITSLKVIYFGDLTNDLYYTNPVYIYILIVLLILSEIWPLIHSLFKVKESKIASIVTYIIFACCMYFLPSTFINENSKNFVTIDYYAYGHKWNKILRETDDDMLNADYRIAFQANRALYHQGKMLEKLCAFPQKFGARALLIEHSINKSILMPTSEIYYDLGLTNESRHWTHEAYTSLGKQPRVLRQLVKTNIVNGNYNTAKKYILLLKKTIVNRKWAEDQEKYLFNESKVAQDKEYSEKRKQTVINDFFANGQRPGEILLKLSQQPGEHLMAFEYLISYHLLRHELGNIISLISEFRKYGFEKLPKLVEESIPLYMVSAQKNAVDLAGYTVPEETFNRFKEYSSLYTKYKNKNPQAKQELDNKFSDTYWYYIHFKSPITVYGAK